jgi:hypothetical protein
MKLNEKIMSALLALALVGFFIAPCCWHSAAATGEKKIIPCSGKINVAHNELNQKKKTGKEVSKTEISKAIYPVE